MGTRLRTGMRRGELLELTGNDLDTRARTLNIRRALQHAPAGGGTALYPTKLVASERRIALPDATLTTRGRPLRLHATGRTPDRTATLTGHFNALLRDTHLRPIRFHDLRHSTATLLLEQGAELVVIKELLGHAHIGVTATVYAHVRLRLQRQAIDLLGQALGNLDQLAAEPDDSDPPLRAAPVR